jgi:hypothetical protein
MADLCGVCFYFLALVSGVKKMENHSLYKQIFSVCWLLLFMLLCNLGMAASAAIANYSINHDVLPGERRF